MSATRSGSGSRCSTRFVGRRAVGPLVRELTAAPDLDGWTIVERLIEDLAPLQERIWLVIDDLDELRSDEAMRQLECFVKCASPEVQFVLSSRSDPHLGLHRLRVDGELTEIRTPDLRFTPTEAQALFESAGVRLVGRGADAVVAANRGLGRRPAAGRHVIGHP